MDKEITVRLPAEVAGLLEQDCAACGLSVDSLLVALICHHVLQMSSTPASFAPRPVPARKPDA